MKYVANVGEEQFVIDINRDGKITVDGKEIEVDMQHTVGSTMYSFLINGKSHEVRMRIEDQCYEVLLGGEILEVMVEDERTRRLAGVRGVTGDAGELVIKAPMPGVVVEVPVKAGQEIEEGETVLVLESMKMQNEFKASRAGTVKRVQVAPGDEVKQNKVMVIIS